MKKYDLTEAVRTTESFSSFEAFKRTKGTAGTGNAWHHIVEQNPMNKAQFPPEALHNSANLIILPHGSGTIHNKVSGFYNSIQDFSEGKRVRHWLNEQSYEFQYEFGLKKLIDFGWVWVN
ncbi:hypothetical protein BFP71_18685 [Roseivirga misakiensis]|uniref:Uncharacterized protein n=1 Tax=Roseivirga misakiensis TaxID=1563681 RepID=A0A1E5T2P5_9BACT|nr:hypothetical protein BFP71_18685 [Roseivirga misakiensis]